MKITKHFLALITCTLSLFVSCNKIAQDEYLVFSGVAGEWYDGKGVSDHSQRAIIEKYTGVRCVNCPNADTVINDAAAIYGDKLIAVSIHDSNLSFTRPIGETPCLSTPDGDAWSHFFGIYATGYPTAIINRTLNGNAWDLFNPTSGINSRVDNIIGQAAQVALDVDAHINNSTVDITVNLEFLQSVGSDLTLTLLLIEDGLVVTQRKPDGDDENYVHNHVLRDVITDVWGADIDCTGASGEKRVALFNYTPVSSEWNLANCHIVAMVSKKDSREILNVAECHID